MLFALCFPAQAQQPKKVPRIGYLALAPFPLTRPVSRHSGRVCASSGTSREKTSHRVAIRGGKTDRLPALAAELVRLKVDIIVTAGPYNPCCQESNRYDSHVMLRIAIRLATGSSPALRGPAATSPDWQALPRS